MREKSKRSRHLCERHQTSEWSACLSQQHERQQSLTRLPVVLDWRMLPQTAILPVKIQFRRSSHVTSSPVCLFCESTGERRSELRGERERRAREQDFSHYPDEEDDETREREKMRQVMRVYEERERKMPVVVREDLRPSLQPLVWCNQAADATPSSLPRLPVLLVCLRETCLRHQVRSWCLAGSGEKKEK